MKQLINLLLLSGLLCYSCQSNTSKPSSDSTATGSEGVYELLLEEHQLAITAELDGRQYLQVFDTLSKDFERATAVVYTCECSQAGECEIAQGPTGSSVVCTSSSSSCKGTTTAEGKCAFKRVKDKRTLAQVHVPLMRTYVHQYGAQAAAHLTFDEQGIRRPNYYDLEFEQPGQLKAIYTLKNGQQIAEYFPRNTGDPIRVSCNCSCPSGDDCSMTVYSSTWIGCRAQSGCMPKADGDPCDGCKFKISDITPEELALQTQSTRTF